MPQSDMGGSSDVAGKINSAIQAQNLTGINASMGDKNTIELSGTANSAKDRKEAVKIAKENANGMKVKDHIKVGASAKSDTTNH